MVGKIETQTNSYPMPSTVASDLITGDYQRTPVNLNEMVSWVCFWDTRCFNLQQNNQSLTVTGIFSRRDFRYGKFCSWKATKLKILALFLFHGTVFTTKRLILILSDHSDKPPIEELHQFLEFQLPRQWAPTYSEHPLGPQRKKASSPSLQFSIMGPKLYINTTQVSIFCWHDMHEVLHLATLSANDHISQFIWRCSKNECLRRLSTLITIFSFMVVL